MCHDIWKKTGHIQTKCLRTEERKESSVEYRVGKTEGRAQDQSANKGGARDTAQLVEHLSSMLEALISSTHKTRHGSKCL